MKKLKRLYLNNTFRKFSCITAAGAGLMAMSPQAQAQTVISDNFSSASNQYGDALAGASVSGAGTVNLPGGNYFLDANNNQKQLKYNDTGYTGGGTPGLGPFFAGFYNAGGVGITLGTYNTGTLTVTGNLLGYSPSYVNNPNNTPDFTTSYLGVGFTSLTSGAANYGTTNPLDNFTGLVALGDGALQDYVNGIATGNPIAYGGTYSPTSAATLSYDLDTATGAISHVSFGSSTATYNFATPGTWSNTYTVSAEILGSGGTADTAANAQGQLGGFSISEAAAVPEPSTYALLTGGVLALGAMQLRRRNHLV